MSAVAGPYVQTVDGPVAPDELGFTLTHEHVFLEMWATDGQGYVGQTRDEDVLAAELTALPRRGGSCLVDQTPGGAGRDPLGLRRMSARTGLKLVPAAAGTPSRSIRPGTTSPAAAPPRSPSS